MGTSSHGAFSIIFSGDQTCTIHFILYLHIPHAYIIYNWAEHLFKREGVERKKKSRERKREMGYEEWKPYILCVFSNICFAGFNIVSKVSLDKGMSRYVLVVYGHAFGTLATALLVLLFERLFCFLRLQNNNNVIKFWPKWLGCMHCHCAAQKQ